MAVGEYQFPSIPEVDGVRFGVAKAGIKPRSDRLDLAVMEICEGASVAGVFTQNAFCAEPVKICRAHMAVKDTRYFVINSGNANACTGEPGWQAAINVCNSLATIAGVSPESVLPFSTGVIGEVLPDEKVCAALPEALSNMTSSGWLNATQAIMTTDTRPKGAFEVIEIGGKKITIAGITKGSGMIKPNMATMLSYVATDAKIDRALLQELCTTAANRSFNRITVDGDTSTNDAFMLVATGKSLAGEIFETDHENYQCFSDALIRVCETLAKEMVRDGEGATKFLAVDVKNGASNEDCLKVGYAVAHSPLVKTALFASDPNWGRVVAAIGYAGVDSLKSENVNVYLDDVMIVEKGGRAAAYTEEAGQVIFDKDEFTISIDLGMGSANETLWTSDLSHDYVKINAEYRS